MTINLTLDADGSEVRISLTMARAEAEEIADWISAQAGPPDALMRLALLAYAATDPNGAYGR